MSKEQNMLNNNWFTAIPSEAVNCSVRIDNYFLIVVVIVNYLIVVVLVFVVGDNRSTRARSDTFRSLAATLWKASPSLFPSLMSSPDSAMASLR